MAQLLPHGQVTGQCGWAVGQRGVQVGDSSELGLRTVEQTAGILGELGKSGHHGLPPQEDGTDRYRLAASKRYRSVPFLVKGD